MKKTTIERILVALDSSISSEAALETVIKLASQFKIELEGIFVEDINLIQLARLPKACAISFFSATEHPLNIVDMERMLKIQAQQMQMRFEKLAQQAHIPFSFRTVRGDVSSTLLAAANKADLLALGKVGTSKLGLGSTAKKAISQAPKAVLLCQQRGHMGQPICTVYDGSEQSERTLRMAVQIAQAMKSKLTIIVCGKEKMPKEQMSFWLDQEQLPISFKITRHSNDILDVWLQEQGIMVLGANNSLLQEEKFQHLLEKIKCPLFLVK